MGKGRACRSFTCRSEEHYDTLALGQAPGWTRERRGWRPCLEWSLVGNQQGQAASGGWHQLFADV